MVKRIFLVGFLFSHLLSYAQNYNAELISQKTAINVDNGKLQTTQYFEIKINNRAGEKFTKITIPFSKIAKVSRIEAFIRNSDRKIVRKLKKSEIIERSSISSSSFYQDNYVKEFTLKHNTYPYTIVYSYQTQEKEFLYIDYWLPVLNRKIPTYSAILSLTIPNNYSVSYSNQLVDEPTIKQSDSETSYLWQTSYTNIVEDEVLTSPLFSFLPSVAIVPQKYKYEINGSFLSWSDHGDWEYELMQGLNELPDKEKNYINVLINGVKDDKEKIKILYHYLQDATRYINVSIETGGLKPYPASYVAENKYGDCKALTNYFMSVLEFVGIKSYYSSVYAGNPIKKIKKSFPSQQFNHVFLFIPLENDSIWLDCTSDGPFNELGTFTQNRDAFIIDKNNSRFLHTPSLSPLDVLETRKVNISYNRNQTSNVNFKNVYKGKMFEIISSIERSFNETDKSRIIRNYISQDGIELNNYSISTNHRDSLNIQLSFETIAENIYEKYGNDILIKNISFSLPQFEKPENRKLPVQINYPIYKIDTLIYAIPSAYKLSSKLTNHSFTNSYGEFNLEFIIQDKSIKVVKSVLINSGFYPIEKYQSFYNFYAEIDKIENNTHITFSK